MVQPSLERVSDVFKVGMDSDESVPQECDNDFVAGVEDELVLTRPAWGLGLAHDETIDAVWRRGQPLQFRGFRRCDIYTVGDY